VTLCPHCVYGCVKKNLSAENKTTKQFLMKMFLGILNNAITFLPLVFISTLFLCVSNKFWFCEKNKKFFINNKYNCEISVKRTKYVKRKIHALF